MNRELLEIKMTDMLDSGYSKTEEAELLAQLKDYPDLAEMWSLMKGGPVTGYDSAFPLRPAEEADLEAIREALEPGVTAELLQWFPRYFAAAALMLVFLTGYFMLSTPQADSYESQVSEWIYLYGEEYELQNNEFLVQELPFRFD
ncbi:MAG: hypothetical protein LAT84_11245 [Balneolia bacterium]|nr:hypothetical protein [Balneolia bacterium]